MRNRSDLRGAVFAAGTSAIVPIASASPPPDPMTAAEKSEKKWLKNQRKRAAKKLKAADGNAIAVLNPATNPTPIAPLTNINGLAIIHTSLTAPITPIGSAAPIAPIGITDPVIPTGLTAPIAPVGPVGPIAPIGTSTPITPIETVAAITSTDVTRPLDIPQGFVPMEEVARLVESAVQEQLDAAVAAAMKTYQNRLIKDVMEAGMTPLPKDDDIVMIGKGL